MTTTTINDEIGTALADGRYGDAVTALVTRDGTVTPAQVKDLLEPYMPVRGDRYLPIREHVSAFHGSSYWVVELVDELIAQDRVALARGPLDGNIQPTGIPIADRWPPNGYREHHWAPVVLQPGVSCAPLIPAMCTGARAPCGRRGGCRGDSRQ